MSRRAEPIPVKPVIVGQSVHQWRAAVIHPRKLPSTSVRHAEASRRSSTPVVKRPPLVARRASAALRYEFRSAAAANLGYVLRDDRSRPEGRGPNRSCQAEFTFAVYQQVAARRYVDEHAVCTLMRLAALECRRNAKTSSAFAGLSKRLKGLEPSPFCMARVSRGRRVKTGS